MPANRVLYVENDEGEAWLFKRRMMERGYAIDVANTVADGLAVFDAAIHGIVISDWHLPDGHAPDIIRGIKSDQPNTPVIVLSGCFRPEFIDEAQRLGVLKCITKSIEPDFLEELDTALSQIAGFKAA